MLSTVQLAIVIADAHLIVLPLYFGQRSECRIAVAAAGHMSHQQLQQLVFIVNAHPCIIQGIELIPVSTIHHVSAERHPIVEIAKCSYCTFGPQ